MHRRVLGKTGLFVSPICIGGWQLAGPLAFNGLPDGHPDPGKAAVLRLIHELGDEGINCIDTAEQYGNGESERRIGEAIHRHRADWIVSTKFGYRVGPDGTRDDNSSPDTIMPSIEGSLRRLRTDYIDVYLYHCAPTLDELEAGRTVLEDVVKQGKCRFYGISTNNLELIRAMAALDMLQVLQYHANMLQDRPEIRTFAESQGIGTQVRGVMGHGRLSGKYFDGAPVWSVEDNRAKLDPADDFKRYAVLRDALPEGLTMAQAAIRWILDLSGNHTICMGAKNLADYRVAIEAASMPPLNPETRARLATGVKALAND